MCTAVVILFMFLFVATGQLERWSFVRRLLMKKIPIYFDRRRVRVVIYVDDRPTGRELMFRVQRRFAGLFWVAGGLDDFAYPDNEHPPEQPFTNLPTCAPGENQLWVMAYRTFLDYGRSVDVDPRDRNSTKLLEDLKSRKLTPRHG